MAFVSELMLVVAIVCTWAVALFLFVIVLAVGIVWPSRILKWIGTIGSAALVSLAVFVVGWVIWMSMSYTPKAENIVQLPPAAVVLTVREELYAGDGTVEFVMPAIKVDKPD
jgi:hypothetical protein